MNNHKIEGLLGLCMKAGGVCFGTEACMEQIQKRKVKLVLVASDAAGRTKRNFEMVCKQYEIPIYYYGTIESLSNAIGKPNKAIFGIRNHSLADEIQKIISGGEIIG